MYNTRVSLPSAEFMRKEVIKEGFSFVNEFEVASGSFLPAHWQSMEPIGSTIDPDTEERDDVESRDSETKKQRSNKRDAHLGNEKEE
jgi:hypothetical protein